jgi:CheY-like chemotaxis protein/HPt (histidine-containing phosphotransfer) domain-containing protein
VEDTGVGIAAEDIEKIFENFSSSYTHRQKGTGLGLAITQRIVSLLSGTITVNSKIGCGSTFSLIIPTGVSQNTEIFTHKPEQNQEPTAKPRCPDQNQFSGRVLVAEDTPTNQTLIRILLEKMGLNIVMTQDGEEAVKAATEQEFDLVLMDIQMPRMDGYDAAKQLRKQGFKKPIVAVTAHAMNGDREKCVEAGCDDYLPKPIDRHHLIDIITKYLTPQANDLGEKIDSVKTQIQELTQMCAPQNDSIVETPKSSEILPADQLIDWSEIMNICDDESVIKEVVDMYRNDSPKCLQSLAESIKAANPKLIKMYAHSLKGASLQIGAKRLGDIAYKLECAGRDKDMDNIPELFNKLQDEYSKLALFLSQPNWMELAKKSQK